MIKTFTISAILFLSLLFYTFVGTYDERIARFCRPVVWTGSGISSLVEKTNSIIFKKESSSSEKDKDPLHIKILHWTNQGRYICESVTWSIFYEDKGVY